MQEFRLPRWRNRQGLSGGADPWQIDTWTLGERIMWGQRGLHVQIQTILTTELEVTFRLTKWRGPTRWFTLRSCDYLHDRSLPGTRTRWWHPAAWLMALVETQVGFLNERAEREAHAEFMAMCAEDDRALNAEEEEFQRLMQKMRG